MFSMNCLIRLEDHGTCVDSCIADLLDRSANKDRPSNRARSVLSSPVRPNMLGNSNLALAIAVKSKLQRPLKTLLIRQLLLRS